MKKFIVFAAALSLALSAAPAFAKGKGKAAEATADAEPAKEKAADAKGYRVQLGAYNSDQAAKSAWTTLGCMA